MAVLPDADRTEIARRMRRAAATVIFADDDWPNLKVFDDEVRANVRRRFHPEPDIEDIMVTAIVAYLWDGVK